MWSDPATMCHATSPQRTLSRPPNIMHPPHSKLLTGNHTGVTPMPDHTRTPRIHDGIWGTRHPMRSRYLLLKVVTVTLHSASLQNRQHNAHPECLAECSCIPKPYHLNSTTQSTSKAWYDPWRALLLSIWRAMSPGVLPLGTADATRTPLNPQHTPEVGRWKCAECCPLPGPPNLPLARQSPP